MSIWIREEARLLEMDIGVRRYAIGYAIGMLFCVPTAFAAWYIGLYQIQWLFIVLIALATIGLIGGVMELSPLGDILFIVLTALAFAYAFLLDVQLMLHFWFGVGLLPFPESLWVLAPSFAIGLSRLLWASGLGAGY